MIILIIYVAIVFVMVVFITTIWKKEIGNPDEEDRFLIFAGSLMWMIVIPYLLYNKLADKISNYIIKKYDKGKSNNND